MNDNENPFELNGPWSKDKDSRYAIGNPHFLDYWLGYAPIFQIAIISSEKAELERKIHLLLAEKDGISSTLEDSTDRISYLERQTREQEFQLIGNRHELDEMKIVNQSLTARLQFSKWKEWESSPHSSFHESRLDLLNRSTAINRSLLNELELSTDFRTTSGLSAASSGIGVEEDDIDCDMSPSQGDIKQVRTLLYSHDRTLCIQLFPSHFRNFPSSLSFGACFNNFQLKEEVWLAYCSIIAMCHQLKSLKAKSPDSCLSLETSSVNNGGIPFQFKVEQLPLGTGERDWKLNIDLGSVAWPPSLNTRGAEVPSQEFVHNWWNGGPGEL